MTNLSANEKSFITLMAKSDEHARRGFELLLKRPTFLKYFDALIEAGLFEPAKNPAPVPVQPEGTVRIPYWTALDYLEACAKVSGETDNTTLAETLMAIVRSVSADSALNGTHDNFHTFRKFAEIIGLLPIASVSSKDLELVNGWLNTRFDHFLVAHALDEGALQRFLASDDPTHLQKAVQLVGYCTTIRWEPRRLGSNTEEPVTIVDDFWLKELINHHALTLGKKIGGEAAELFTERVREVFGRGDRAKYGYMFFHAVEDAGQNSGGSTAEHCAVSGLRDVLLGWCDVGAMAAKPFVDSLLRSENEMHRRIGIFVLGQRWVHLRELYLPIVSSDLFDGGQRRELYALLRNHFEDFSNEEKMATLEAIQNLPIPKDDDANRHLERVQHRWLGAITGTTYEPAAEWLAELTHKYGSPPEHPDGVSVIESRWGTGPSQYSVQELVALAEEGSIVEILLAFKPSDAWGAPTIEGLVDELEHAVEAAPAHFVGVLPDFLKAPRQYQYGLVNGFLKLWRASKESATPSHWDDVVWNRLFDFFDQLLKDPQFWKTGEAKGLEVTPRWISDTIADLLHDGTRDDKHAYPAALLPRAWSLIQILVEHGEAVTEPSDNPMNQAINSSKGRALKAAFSHILRNCRLADKARGSHATAWADAHGLINQELARCVGDNFEFSTLCGAYLGNLEYIDSHWLQEHIGEIFSVAHPINLRCALGGLAYASATRQTYRMLRDADVMDAALRLEFKDQHGREKLLERLTLGYLWEEETLDSPRFTYLFESDRVEDFELINFFLWSNRGGTLKPKQVVQIVDYWQRCVKWAQKLATPPAKVLSSLSGLTAFLATAAKENLDLLLAVAPYVDVHHSAYEFLDELNRLVEVSPAEVRTVLATFIDTHEPFYDYKNKMQILVRHLADLEFRSDAIDFCNKLRSMPSMADLYYELTASS